MSHTISRQVTVVDTESYTHILTLHFDSDKPFEVKLTFTENNSWLCGRDVIVDGLKDHNISGLSDIFAWSSYRSFFLRLSSPDGEATLIIPRHVIRHFVADMERIIPLDEASMDMDAVIAQILTEADR